MSDNIDSTRQLLERLRTPENQAYVVDQIEESLMEVDKFQRLDTLSDRDFVTEHYMFSEEAGDVAILCKRSTGQEQCFVFTGVVVAGHFLPIQNFRDLNRAEVWAPPAHQYMLVTMLGAEHGDLVRRGLENIYVLARLRRPEGALKPLNQLEIDGDPAFCARTPITTPRARMLDDEEPLQLTLKQDPRHIVQQYCAQRDHVVLEDNQVDVYFTEHLKKAGTYKQIGEGLAGALVRPGQIVRVEVGFRIVPAGAQCYLRMELKVVEIIHDSVAASMLMAQSEAGGQPKNKISIFSAGPSQVAISTKRSVKRAPRKKAAVGKAEMDVDVEEEMSGEPVAGPSGSSS